MQTTLNIIEFRHRGVTTEKARFRSTPREFYTLLDATIRGVVAAAGDNANLDEMVIRILRPTREA